MTARPTRAATTALTRSPGTKAIDPRNALREADIGGNCEPCDAEGVENHDAADHGSDEEADALGKARLLGLYQPLGR